MQIPAIQHVCERELLNMVTEKKARRGSVIVMNPKNGEILGYAVYPRYNPNNYKKTKAELLKKLKSLMTHKYKI